MTGIHSIIRNPSKQVPKEIQVGLTVSVTGEHHISKARMAAISLAYDVGMNRTNAYYIGTSVSELAGNLFFHCPRGGTITLTPIQQRGKAGIEVISEDNGPGIPDLDLAMEDGFTTNKGLGGGLPGVRRLMDEFEIKSEVGKGTKIITRKWQKCV